MCNIIKISILTAILAIAMLSCKKEKETVIKVNSVTVTLPAGVGNTLTEGDTYPVTVTVSPKDADNSGVTLVSSNTSVIRVTETSTGWTITAAGAGEAVITVTAKDGSGATASITLTVQAATVPVESVTIEMPAGGATLFVNGTLTLTAKIMPANSTSKIVVWTSDAPAVATVADGVVTGVSAGKAKITASAGGKSDECEVTVNAATVASIAVTTPPARTEPYGVGEPFDPTGMVVTATYNNTNTAPVNNELLTFDDFSAEAGAGKTVTITYEGQTTQIPGISVLTLNERIAAVASGATAIIYLYANETVSTGITVNTGRDITLKGVDGERAINDNCTDNTWGTFNVSNANLTFDENVTCKSIADSHMGPAVCVGAYGTFIMKDGSKITGHRSTNGYGGGAVMCPGGDFSYFIMEGGEISGNSSVDRGGGVSLYGGLSLIMKGGKIVNNTSDKYGNDVYAFVNNPVIVSGNAQIGELALYAFQSGGGPVNSKVTLAGNFGGSIGLDLLVDGNVPDVANSFWVTNGIPVVVPEEESTILTKTILDKFTLGNIVGVNSYTILSKVPITGYHLYGTEDGENTQADFGKLIKDYVILGSGTSADPYQIGTAAQLAKLAELVNAGNADYNDKYYKLNADIDISAYGKDWNDGKGWISIGIEPNNFKGDFDGNKHVVSGLYINKTSNFGGLFGSTYGAGVQIQNLGVEGVVTCGNYAGGVSGSFNGGSISNCYTSVIVNGGDYVGGVVGEFILGSIMTNCYATGSVNGHNFVGGVVGDIQYAGSTITNCYATGSVNGNDFVSGIIGRLWGGNVTNCVAVNPNITGFELHAGRVKGMVNADITGSNNIAYSGMTVNGATVTGGTATNRDGADITAADAQKQSTYEDLGWKFGTNDDNPWKMGVGDYKLPVFYWQTTAPAAMPEHLK